MTMARSTPARQPHAKLAPLLELARNLYWSWDADCLSLFAGIDPVLWKRTEHNPTRMIRRLSSGRQAELAGDREFMAKLRHCQRKLQDYLRAPTWLARTAGDSRMGPRAGGTPQKAKLNIEKRFKNYITN
jgi:glucan phosphorylase